MDGQLFEKGTIALVTGGSSGIGRACSIELAKRGAYVIVNYNSSKEGAQATLDEILKAGGSGAIVKANVADADEVDAMFKLQAPGYHREQFRRDPGRLHADDGERRF